MRKTFFLACALSCTPLLANAQGAAATPAPLRGNTAGLFQPAKPTPQARPAAQVQPATQAWLPAPAPTSQPAAADRPVAVGQPVSATRAAPYEGCVSLVRGMKKRLPSLTEQTTAAQYVGSYQDQYASYQFICTRAGQSTFVVVPLRAAAPLGNGKAPAATPPRPAVVPTAVR